MRRGWTSTATTSMVAVVYAAQGLGYAVVVTALPAVKDRMAFSDTVVSGILLMVCAAATVGSGLANAVALRRGSRTAGCLGFVLQSVGLAGMSIAPDRMVYLCAVAVYGLALGTVDASNNMQGVAVRDRDGASIMGRLYSALTVGGVVGAVLASLLAARGASALALMGAVAILQLAVAVAGGFWLVPTLATRPTADEPRAAQRVPLPRRAMLAVGSLVLVAYLVDSAVATWSAIYLSDGLRASAAMAPAGYAAYLTVVFVARLVNDLAVLRWGRRTVALFATIVAALGCALVVLGSGTAAAITGFGLAGIGTGALVPIAFASAGELLPSRRDEVIARVNVFNYAGAVVGAVAPGLVGAGTALRLGFLGPALALLLVLSVALRLPTVPSAYTSSLPEGELA
ncbi:MAG TPA: MFS transporter [Kineosporiaceae bacterium]